MYRANTMKREIRHCLGKALSAKYDEIERAVSRAQIVSFDIFDTLVKRDVAEPEEVHRLVSAKFQKQTGKSIDGYLKLRVDAEKKARKNACKEGVSLGETSPQRMQKGISSEEISLEEIFACMEGVTKQDKFLLQRLERETELQICCPNLPMKAIYEKALKGQKRILIVSDMYLEEPLIIKILERCGYHGYEKLYLSSTYGMCKSTGSIYEAVKKDYGSFQGKILHIGDHVKSDFFMAKAKGLNALLTDGRRNGLRFWKRVNRKAENPFLYGRLFSFLNNHKTAYGDAACIGYEVLGPMLLGYCKWLKEKIESDRIEKIFFLSREGKLLQEAFRILYPDCAVPQCYVCVSRQALLVPLLADAADFDGMIAVLKCFFHRPLLNTLGAVCKLEPESFQRELRKVGLCGESQIHEIPKGKKRDVYDIVKRLGGARFQRQKEYVEAYLKENQFHGNLAIVDIGWKGTMQTVLQKYAGAGTALHGYYLGVMNMESGEYYDGMCRNGYLFEPGWKEEYALMERLTGQIFEILFLSATGTVQEYAMEKGAVRPVFAEPEYAGAEGEFIDSLQSAALQFLEMARENGLCEEEGAIHPDIAMSPYARFAVYPSMSTIKIFEKFRFVDGEMHKLLPEHGIFYYARHPKIGKQDLNECLCKIFFLRKLLKVNLPYFKILQLFITKLHMKSDYRKKYYSKEEDGA